MSVALYTPLLFSLQDKIEAAKKVIKEAYEFSKRSL